MGDSELNSIYPETGITEHTRAMMGMIEEEYRLPLVAMSSQNRETLKATLVACGVL